MYYVMQRMTCDWQQVRWSILEQERMWVERMIVDRILLSVYGVLLLFLVGAGGNFVVGALLGIIWACITYIRDEKWIGILTAAAAAVTACFYPESILFWPVISYGIFCRKAPVWLALWFPAAIYRYSFYEPVVWGFLLFGVAAAGWLAWRAMQHEALAEDSRRLQDDTTEKNLLLAEKNQSLIEKQDYEIYAATLRERNRIAREIHDNVGHVLSRTLIMIGAMKTINKDEKMGEPLEQLQVSLSAAMDSVRESVHDLHDEAVDIQEVLKELVERFDFCRARLEYDMGRQVPRKVKYAFIAIAKESLVNVQKHSNATEVLLIVRSHPALYQLIIEDNGSRPGGVSDEGLGLRNMKERVESLDGTIQISRDKGFRIFITVPRKEKEA